VRPAVAEGATPGAENGRAAEHGRYDAADLIVGEAVRTEGALVVINATSAPLSILLSRQLAAVRRYRTPLPTIPPLSVRKVGFSLAGPAPSPWASGR